MRHGAGAASRGQGVIWVLLPAFDEEPSLAAFVGRIAEVCAASGAPYRIVVCDDGSADGTRRVLSELASSLPIEIIDHKLNRGLGETSRDLFEHAAEAAAPDDILVRMDCDDTHSPELIPAMLAAIAAGADVVIASRFRPGGGQRGVDGYRAFVSRAANLFMRVVFRVPGVREYSCGYRAYRATAIQRAIAVYGNNFIQLKGLGFTCTLEKLIKLDLLGARFAEVPFVLRYDRKLSGSKMASSITTLGYLVMAVLYHWPWGGWRRTYAHLGAEAARGAAVPAAGDAGR